MVRDATHAGESGRAEPRMQNQRGKGRTTGEDVDGGRVFYGSKGRGGASARDESVRTTCERWKVDREGAGFLIPEERARSASLARRPGERSPKCRARPLLSVKRRFARPPLFLPFSSQCFSSLLTRGRESATGLERQGPTGRERDGGAMTPKRTRRRPPCHPPARRRPSKTGAKDNAEKTLSSSLSSNRVCTSPSRPHPPLTPRATWTPSAAPCPPGAPSACAPCPRARPRAPTSPTAPARRGRAATQRG